MRRRHHFVGLCLAVSASACSPANDNDAQGPDRRESLPGKVLYKAGGSAPPERLSLPNGQCWDLSRISAPWRLAAVTTTGFTIRAGTDALGLDSGALAARPPTVAVSSVVDGDAVPAPSPSIARIRALKARRLLAPVPERAVPGFTAYALPGPSNERLSLVDSAGRTVCLAYPGAARTADATVRCRRRLDGVVVTYRVNAAWLPVLEQLKKAVMTEVDDLRCEAGAAE